MPDIRADIISIGTLSRNRFWNERDSVRTAHATCTLIRSGGRKLLVDPGLPGPALRARLYERCGLQPADIDMVFLTSFRPAHRGGLALFEHAQWLIGEQEHRFADELLERRLTEAQRESLGEEAGAIRRELALLRRCTVAEDKPLPLVDLFPLPGFTPGTCGLLLSLSTVTLLVAGDGVLTEDHLLGGEVDSDSMDVAAAKESLREAYEIADWIVPGHGNLMACPRAAVM